MDSCVEYKNTPQNPHKHHGAKRTPHRENNAHGEGASSGGSCGLVCFELSKLTNQFFGRSRTLMRAQCKVYACIYAHTHIAGFQQLLSTLSAPFSHALSHSYLPPLPSPTPKPSLDPLHPSTTTNTITSQSQLHANPLADCEAWLSVCLQ